MSTPTYPKVVAEYRDRLRGGTRQPEVWPTTCRRRSQQHRDDAWAGPGGASAQGDVTQRRLALLRDAVLVSSSVVAGAIAGGLVWMLFPDEAGAEQPR